MERPAGQRESPELLFRGCHQAWVAVPEVQGAVSGQHVQVATAVGIPDPCALTAGEDDGQGTIVVGRVGLDLLDRVLALRRGSSCHVL